MSSSICYNEAHNLVCSLEANFIGMIRQIFHKLAYLEIVLPGQKSTNVALNKTFSVFIHL